jgi:hypothetical protein
MPVSQNTRMKDDHYVAQTYLKHFAGPSGMLRAYRKSDGHSFPCWPKDICHESDGDILHDFLSDPAYLGEFRKAFEPMWNHACQIAFNCDPAFASNNDPESVRIGRAETRGAEPYIAEQSRSWRSAGGEREVMLGS